jgi:hypothetical protein
VPWSGCYGGWPAPDKGSFSHNGFDVPAETTPNHIRLYRNEKGWEFLFLAANQDAIASANAMHMDTHLSANVRFSVRGMKSTAGAMSRKVRAMRMKSFGFMDAQAMADDAKSMNDIVKEEEQKP